MFDALDAAEVAPRCDGGWGIDALLRTADPVSTVMSILGSPVRPSMARSKCCWRWVTTITADERPARVVLTSDPTARSTFTRS